MKKWILSVVFILLACGIGATQERSVAPQRARLRAQTLVVSNYLQPDGLPAKDSLTALSGVTFADSSAFDLFGAPTTLNGVSVWVDGIPQPIRSVTPDQVVFVLTRRSPHSVVRVQTQSGIEYSAQFVALDYWPAVMINGDPQSETGQNFIPLAFYGIGQFIAPVTTDPVPVGQQIPTIVVIHGSGWRNAPRVSVRLNGIECRVTGVSAHPIWPGIDTVAFEIPPYLANNGAMDVTVFVGNRTSNFSRIYLGAAQ